MMIRVKALVLAVVMVICGDGLISGKGEESGGGGGDRLVKVDDDELTGKG